MMRINPLYYLLCVMLTMSLPLSATAAEHCETHLAQQDYQQAFKVCMQEAKEGSANAQALLGAMYYEGAGVAQNKQQAAVWLRKAAQRNNADAQALLGAMYLEGSGVLQDKKQAIKWLTKAAEQGNAQARAILQTLNNQ